MHVSTEKNIPLPSLIEMGVDPTDQSALAKLEALTREMTTANCVFSPAEDSGVYRVKIANRTIAYFKVGRRRARVEILARKIAHRLGLGERVIPGTFYVYKSPENIHTAEEELWNGFKKVFVDESEKKSEKPSDEEFLSSFAPTFEEADFALEASNEENSSRYVIGILEPFVHQKRSDPRPSLSSFAETVIAAIAIGLRDGKKDNIVKGVLIDVEDCMPYRLDPDPSKKTPQAAATHLPFLADPHTFNPLGQEEIDHLVQLVKSWNPGALAEAMGKETIVLADEKAEKMGCGEQNVDEGQMPVEIEGNTSHAINGQMRVDSAQKRVLNARQLTAFTERLTRIQTFILTTKSFTLFQLVCHVDPQFKAQYEYLQKDTKEKRTGVRGDSQEHLFGAVGFKPIGI